MTPPAVPTDLVEQVAAELAGARLSAVVDLVAHPEGPPRPGGPAAVVVRNHAGAVRLTLDADGHERHEVLGGRDPVADTDPMAFLPYHLEIADPSPDNDRNAYPEPARRLLSLFADPDRSPDLVVVHTPRHYFPAEGGHRGEHGSLDVIQSRAPFVVVGEGGDRGARLDAHARIVDVTPTLLHLAGIDEHHHRDAAGRPLDGRARVGPADPRPGRAVVGLLWDGAPSSELLAMADAGDLPAVARLLAAGTAWTGGAVAEFPSVTLCNHTSALTGVGPGRHGILGNVFYDRRRRERIVANDARSWHRSAQWLRPGAATVFEMVTRAQPSARTACVNEPVDRSASFSTMQVVRARSGPGGASDLDGALPAAATSPHLGNRAHLDDRYFTWATRVDDAGLAQMLGLFGDGAPPLLTWWSTVVTDAGHHAGGPRSRVARDSLRDADRRLGAFLAHLDRLGSTGDVSFLLTADHGFEAADEQVTGSWQPVLERTCRRLGLGYRDEGPGFVYLSERERGPGQT